MITLKNKPDGTIHVDEMKDGDIAEIVSWAPPERIGQLVLRAGEAMIYFGILGTESHPNFFKSPTEASARVRILPPGTELFIS